MIRCLPVTVAYVALRSIQPSSSTYAGMLPVSEDHHSALLSFLKWASFLFAILDLNTALSKWAENRWTWKADNSSWDWKKEIAIVTGGSQGIGAAIAKRLVSFGITVAVLDVEPLSDSFQPSQRAHVHYYHCDVGSRNAVHSAAEAFRSDHGVPSILINNAGIGNANTILQATPERLRTMLDVNLLAHFNTVQEFLPGMLQMKKGHIMGVASMASFFGLAGMVDYSCTKAAVHAFHEGLTQELKHRYKCPQIKTTIVYPNWTKSRITTRLESSIRGSGQSLLEPEDVATAIVDQILAARSGQIIMGPSIAVWVRALPAWIQEFIRDRMAQVVTIDHTTAVALAS